MTLATIKKFIRDNKERLYIKNLSQFDGNYDCTRELDGGFVATKPNDEKHRLVDGGWFVLDSADYFTWYQDDEYVGYKVYNCCGSFIIGIKR